MDTLRPLAAPERQGVGPTKEVDRRTGSEGREPQARRSPVAPLLYLPLVQVPSQFGMRDSVSRSPIDAREGRSRRYRSIRRGLEERSQFRPESPEGWEVRGHDARIGFRDLRPQPPPSLDNGFEGVLTAAPGTLYGVREVDSERSGSRAGRFEGRGSSRHRVPRG